MTDAIDVSFSMLIVSFIRPGRIARIACGRMMRRKVSVDPMPREAAARDCVVLTERMPPRMISALKAASFSAKPITAVAKLSSRRPIAGSASKMKTSCSNCGGTAGDEDIGPGRRGYESVGGQPHQRQPQAEQQSARHRDRGDLHREQRPVPQEAGRGVGREVSQPGRQRGFGRRSRRHARNEHGDGDGEKRGPTEPMHHKTRGRPSLRLHGRRDLHGRVDLIFG